MALRASGSPSSGKAHPSAQPPLLAPEPDTLIESVSPARAAEARPYSAGRGRRQSRPCDRLEDEVRVEARVGLRCALCPAPCKPSAWAGPRALAPFAPLPSPPLRGTTAWFAHPLMTRPEPRPFRVRIAARALRRVQHPPPISDDLRSEKQSWSRLLRGSSSRDPGDGGAAQTRVFGAAKSWMFRRRERDRNIEKRATGVGGEPRPRQADARVRARGPRRGGQSSRSRRGRRAGVPRPAPSRAPAARHLRSSSHRCGSRRRSRRGR